MLNNGKEALLQWVQHQTSLSDVTDFSTSWKDGKALYVLVSSMWPKNLELSAIPITPEARLSKALAVAVECGAPQLVEPSEFGSEEIEASLIMLISELYQMAKSRKPTARASRQQYRQSQFIAYIPYCAKCNNPLSHINVECGGKHYHTECFSCSLCETKLTASCIVIGPNPFCEPCGKKSFKMATWKLHKKDKPRWWLDLWRTSTHQFPGLTKDRGQSSHSDSTTEDTGDELDDDLFYSDDESEGDSPQARPRPASTSPGIQHDDVLLDQIEDEVERRAFIELFPRLPEPEPVAVQLRLTETPISTSPLSQQPVRNSYQAPSVSSLSLSDEGKGTRSRAHRSAMFIAPSAVPTPPTPPPRTTTTTTTTTTSSTSTTTIQKRIRNRESIKPIPSPASSLSALSTRSAVAYSVHMKRPPTDQEDSSSPSSSPQTSPASSPRDTSRDSVYSNFSVSELSDSSNRQSVSAPIASSSISSPPSPASSSPSSSPKPETTDEEKRKLRISRMFAANVSKLLSSGDMEEVEDPPIREGFLIKKMDLGVVRPWQRRYFLLRRDQLMYFVNKESRQKGLTLGIIPLSSVTQINPITPALWSRFQLVGENGMNWYLQASSRTEMLIWLQVLRKACHVRNEGKLQELSSIAGLSLTSLQKKEGNAEVRSKSAWVNRWIVLKDGILWEYASKNGPLKAKIALYKCQLNEYQPSSGLINQLIGNNQSANNSFAFHVTSPTRNTIIRTTSAEEMHGWLNAILKQKVIVEEIIETVALEPE